jgi:IclR family pca regulon transcriptional regulator
MRDRQFITSLERGLKILEILGEASRPLSLTEIADQTLLTKTTIHRFLHTLYTIGYINRDENKKYSLTSKILSLGFNFLNSSTLTKLVRPYIDGLSLELDNTINLAILDGFEVVYLYRKEVTRFLKYDLGPGSKLPAYCTAAGKILLAGLSDEKFKMILKMNELKPVTPKTITLKKVLLKEIEKTQERGYSICDRELSMDLYSMAVPLLNKEGKTIAAINVTMSAGKKNARFRKDLIKRLAQKGWEISRLLGFEGIYTQAVTDHPKT